jgi:hypothetical protein
MHLFVQKGHDEFFVVGVDPRGEVAYGFTSHFAFSYDLETHNVTYLSGWPIQSFLPRAVDVNRDDIAVIAGFVGHAGNSYKPLVYEMQMNISSLTVIDTWAYTPANSSWQATALNRGAANFTTEYVMSVAIHANTSQLLIGMPFLNTAFWFYMTPMLKFMGSRENGYQRGYGQTVAWNDEIDGPSPVILGNAYSFPFEWSSSIIDWFMPTVFLSNDSVMPLFPTTQYPRWIDFGQQFITIACTTFNVAILDPLGQVYVLVATPEGYYTDTSTAIGENPAFSSPISCQAGMYKNWVGLDICYPCSIGTMSEFEGSINCTSYNCNTTDSFCPIGSTTDDTYSDLIISVSQATAYPKSPDLTVFDDILIQNMFSFGDSARCLRVSPLFWTAMMIGIAGFILFIMGILKFFHRWANIRHTIKRVFQQVDLIKEGELWIGGLASFGLIILLVFAFTFSNDYLYQYPIETSLPSTFACDTSLRNAQFQTSLQSLSIPLSNEEQPIFDMLDEQQFTLIVDFINTKYECSDIDVTQTSHAYAESVTHNCSYNRSVLTISIILASHTVAFNYTFDDALSIGGLRISLYGKEKTESNRTLNTQYLVRELNFIQPFLINNQTLASDPSIDISLTRVINETDPLSGNGEYIYSAVWVPASTTNISTLFLTMGQFLYYGLLTPSLSISISEMTYFVSNVQQPIAKQSEVIFHNLLFTIVCFELFGLAFLIMKLACLPLFNIVRRFIEKHANLVHPHQTFITVKHREKTVTHIFRSTI